MVILALDFALFITMRRQFMEPLYVGNIVMFGADIIFLASSSMLSKYDQHAEVKSLFSSIRYHLWRDGVLNTVIYIPMWVCHEVCHLFCNTFPLKYLENVQNTQN